MRNRRKKKNSRKSFENELKKNKFDEKLKNVAILENKLKKIATKNQKNFDFRKIRNRRFDLNMTNETHRNKNENFLFVNNFDERTQKFFSG